MAAFRLLEEGHSLHPRIRTSIRELAGLPLAARQKTASMQACMAEEAAEELAWFVIPSEARNLSSVETQEKRDSSLRRLRSE